MTTRAESTEHGLHLPAPQSRDDRTVFRERLEGCSREFARIRSKPGNGNIRVDDNRHQRRASRVIPTMALSLSVTPPDFRILRIRATTSDALWRTGVSVATCFPCFVIATTSPLSISSDRWVLASNTPPVFIVLVYHSSQNNARSPSADHPEPSRPTSRDEGPPRSFNSRVMCIVSHCRPSRRASLDRGPSSQKPVDVYSATA